MPQVDPSESSQAGFDAAKPSVQGPLWRFLGGFKLTLGLFACLGLFAAVGSFIPQADETPRIAQIWGEDAMRTMVSLGLNDVYRSWWFVLVLALMALNLLMVTWVRVPHVWRISRETDAKLLDDPLVPKTAFYRQWDSPLQPLEGLDRARKALQTEFPRLAQKDGPRTRVLVGERHFISLWSAHIVHLGLLLLLFAGVLKVLFGSIEYVVIKEGGQAVIPAKGLEWGLFFEPVRIPGTQSELKLPFVYKRSDGEAPFWLHLDRFEVRYHPGTAAPSLFRSDLRIVKDGRIERVVSLKVNEPHSQDGYTLYQSSWGYDGLYSANFELRLPGEKDALDVRAPYQQRVKLLDSGWEAEVTDFYPEAEMSAPGQLVNASTDLKNPAIRVKFWQNGRERAHTWYVYAMPDIQMAKIDGLRLTGKTVDPIPFSVLQANVDPGVPFALLGSLLVLTGVFTAFYLFYRKAWVAVEPLEQGGCKITLAGFVRRNKAGFSRVFDRVADALDRALTAEGPSPTEEKAGS
jgi:cytochrome c biogenesis protein